MADQAKERWYQLCALAAVEQDTRKLLALVSEINSLLEMKDRGTNAGRIGDAWVNKKPVQSERQDTHDQQLTRHPTV